MLRRTYGSVKSELARLAGATGMNAADARLMQYLNVATEELISEGDWPTIIDRLKFTLTKNTFVLPSDYDRMMYCTVCDVPLQMQSPWYEFVGFGLELANYSSDGTSCEPRHQGVIDKDTAATFQPIPTGDGNTYYPRVYTQVDERIEGVRPSIIIQGYDDNNQWIRTSDGAGGYIDGVEIELNGDTAPFYIQSDQAFSYVSGIIKPVTKKNVMLYASTVDGSIMWYIGQYAGGDTTPLYRQYSIPTLNLPTDESVTRTVIARCRRRYVPIRTDSDFLLISNLPALKAMIQAVYYMEANAPESYMKYKLVAIDLLRKEAKAYIGLSNQKPIMTISETAGERPGFMYIH